MRYFFESLLGGYFPYVRYRLHERFVRPLSGWWCRCLSVPYLPLISAQIVSHCNLNCKCCNALSPIAEAGFYDVGQLEKDLLELASKIRTNVLILVGGESLLHPNIIDILKCSRRAFPKTHIVLLTNGVLAKSMPDAFWKAAREARIVFHVTVYPPFAASGIFDFIKERATLAMPGPKVGSEWSRRAYSFKRSRDDTVRFFKACYWKCHMLSNSKLFVCQSYCLQHYNRYFNENHETVKGYDIYKYSGKELVEFMKRPDPACRYCTWVMKKETAQWDYSKREKSEWCEDV